MQLNYFPISVEFDKFQIYSTPYSDEILSNLRKNHNQTHSFFRNGDHIFISNKSGEDLEIGSLVDKSFFGDSEVSASLMKHLFFRTFKDRFPNYTPVDFYPFRFFSEQSKDDLIFEELPSNLQNKIAYKKMIEVQLRLTEINNQKRFGFLINIKRNWVFNKNCLELATEDFNIVGMEVLHAETLPGLDKILAPNEELVGIVQEKIGEKAKVVTNEGLKEFALDELFIKKSKFNIGAYLTHALGQEKSDSILKTIEDKRSDIYNAKTLYSEILNIAKRLFLENNAPVCFQNKDGFVFTVDSKPISFSNSIELKTPTFIFDYAATKTHNSSPDLGLNNYGPYDSINFDVKTPNVLCICNRANRGIFSNFLSKLKDGIPQSRYFQKGLLKKYDLQDIIFDIKEITTHDVDEYTAIIRGYDENRPALAIIEIPFEFRALDDSINPYYKIKAKLLSLEIPVQFITSDKIRDNNEYILNSIALQIYAKMGGTPWVLPTQRSVDREIIIGIGHSWIRENHFKGAESNRVVGITTFLSSDGQYLLGDKVKDVPFENYFSELLKSLKSSIQRLSTEQGWIEGDTVRLIFHIFKPIKNTEFDVISQLIKETTLYKIKFAFVTISKVHPSMLFDPLQTGVKKYGTNTLMGEFIPRRGTNIFLDSETCIVQMFGANELKTSKHRISTPIQIKIRTPVGQYDGELNSLLFYDLAYITQQIFSFTYLSWRSFLPNEQPATMLYSNLISKLLGKMRSVNGWNADSLNYGLKRKKWFL